MSTINCYVMCVDDCLPTFLPHWVFVSPLHSLTETAVWHLYLSCGLRYTQGRNRRAAFIVLQVLGYWVTSAVETITKLS